MGDGVTNSLIVNELGQYIYQDLRFFDGQTDEQANVYTFDWTYIDWLNERTNERKAEQLIRRFIKLPSPWYIKQPENIPLYRNAKRPNGQNTAKQKAKKDCHFVSFLHPHAFFKNDFPSGGLVAKWRGYPNYPNVNRIIFCLHCYE